jgi:hypothetical protein
LSSIAAENNSTIVFPVPMELFRGFTHHANERRSKRPSSRPSDSFDMLRRNSNCGISSERGGGHCNTSGSSPPPQMLPDNPIITTELDLSVDQILRADLESPSIPKYKE